MLPASLVKRSRFIAGHTVGVCEPAKTWFVQDKWLARLQHQINKRWVQVVWSCSTRSLLLWCAHSGAFLGALLRERDTDALFSDLEMPPAAAVPPAVAEREERKHFVDPGKVSSRYSQ